VKLNLGCWNDIKEGYLNIDLYSEKADLRVDITKPLPFSNETVDEIFASHVVQYFTNDEWLRSLKDWYRVLKFGGILYVQVPDLIKSMHQFLGETDYNKKWFYWTLPIFSLMNHGDIYLSAKNGFDLSRLKKDIFESGFVIKSSGEFGTNSIEVRATKEKM